MTCSHCRTGFCWVCFKDCGDDSHPHARAEHGSYFPSRAFVRGWHRRHRWLRIDALLQKAGLPRESPQRVAALEPCRALLADRDVALWPFPVAEPKTGGRLGATGSASRPAGHPCHASRGFFFFNKNKKYKKTK